MNTGTVIWSVQEGEHDGKEINRRTYSKLRIGEWYFTLVLNSITGRSKDG